MIIAGKEIAAIHLAERLALRAKDGPVFLTTRYLPKRHDEVAGQGSLFWILKHQLVARSPILSFGEAEGGRCAIHIDPALVLVQGTVAWWLRGR